MCSGTPSACSEDWPRRPRPMPLSSQSPPSQPRDMLPYVIRSSLTQCPSCPEPSDSSSSSGSSPSPSPSLRYRHQNHFPSSVDKLLSIEFTALREQALQFGVVADEEHPDSAQCVVKRVLIEHSFELSTLLFFVGPMTLITILYALIGLNLRKSAIISKSGGSFVADKRRLPARNSSSQRVLKMLGMVSQIYIYIFFK